MNNTEVGFKALRGFILRTFFNKMKQFEAAVDCVVLVKGTAYSKKTGAMSQHVIPVGNTEYAQAKAHDYMSTFLLNEMPDNSDTRLVESARLVKPVMWASEPAKVGITSAVDITKILWHKEFDDTKTIDGKKFGRDCKQIWDTACTNPHMMPAWWNTTVPGHNIAFTRANVVLHYKVIVETKGQEAFDIEMKRYADAVGCAEEAETTRRIIAIQEAIGALATLSNVSTGAVMTVNVEYNQLDPLLRGTTHPEGDANDAETGVGLFVWDRAASPAAAFSCVRAPKQSNPTAPPPHAHTHKNNQRLLTVPGQHQPDHSAPRAVRRAARRDRRHHRRVCQPKGVCVGVGGCVGGANSGERAPGVWH